MARRLDKLPPRPGPPNRSKYPWDTWLDGSAWVAVRGVDFSPTVESFRRHICQSARARGYAIETRRLSDTEVAWQATPKAVPREPHTRWTREQEQAIIDGWWSGMRLSEISELVDAPVGRVASRVQVFRGRGVEMPRRNRSGVWASGVEPDYEARPRLAP